MQKNLKIMKINPLIIIQSLILLLILKKIIKVLFNDKDNNIINYIKLNKLLVYLSFCFYTKKKKCI